MEDKHSSAQKKEDSKSHKQSDDNPQKITNFFPLLRTEGRAKMCGMKTDDSKQKEMLKKIRIKSKESMTLRSKRLEKSAEKSQSSSTSSQGKEKARNISVASALKTPLSQVLRKSIEASDKKESGKSNQTKVSENSGKSTQQKNSESTGKSSQTKIGENTGRSSLSKVTESTGKSSQQKNVESFGKPSQTKAAESSGRPSQTKAAESSGRPSQTKAAESSGRPSQSKATESSVRPSQAKVAESSGKPGQTKVAESSGKPSQTKVAESSGKPNQTKVAEISGKPSQNKVAESSGKPSQMKIVESSGRSSQIKTENTGKALNTETKRAASDGESGRILRQKTTVSEKPLRSKTAVKRKSETNLTTPITDKSRPSSSSEGHKVGRRPKVVKYAPDTAGEDGKSDSGSVTSSNNKVKKMKRRHFRGGTYGLYLTPARKRKKKLMSQDESKDDECSVTSTENNSFLDSEDANSMVSEDFFTPSEKSLVDDEHNLESQNSSSVPNTELKVKNPEPPSSALSEELKLKDQTVKEEKLEAKIEISADYEENTQNVTDLFQDIEEMQWESDQKTGEDIDNTISSQTNKSAQYDDISSESFTASLHFSFKKDSPENSEETFSKDLTVQEKKEEPMSIDTTSNFNLTDKSGDKIDLPETSETCLSINDNLSEMFDLKDDSNIASSDASENKEDLNILNSDLSQIKEDLNLESSDMLINKDSLNLVFSDANDDKEESDFISADITENKELNLDSSDFPEKDNFTLSSQTFNENKENSNVMSGDVIEKKGSAIADMKECAMKEIDDSYSISAAGNKQESNSLPGISGNTADKDSLTFTNQKRESDSITFTNVKENSSNSFITNENKVDSDSLPFTNENKQDSNSSHFTNENKQDSNSLLFTNDSKQDYNNSLSITNENKQESSSLTFSNVNRPDSKSSVGSNQNKEDSNLSFVEDSKQDSNSLFFSNENKQDSNSLIFANDAKQDSSSLPFADENKLDSNSASFLEKKNDSQSPSFSNSEKPADSIQFNDEEKLDAVMVEAVENKCEDVQSDLQSRNDPLDSHMEVDHLEKQHDDEDEDGQSTIANCVKSRQRIKRRFTDDIVDTDLGILSAAAMASVNKKALISKQEMPKDIIENFQSVTRNEVKRSGTVSKIECVFNYKQTPIKSCTCEVETYKAKMDINPEAPYCHAIDSIDDKLVGCSNLVVTSRLVRPSVKLPFSVMCETHLWRLKHHHSCPYCGLFCSQGSFMACTSEKNPRSVHYFHEQCQSKEEGFMPFCFHCGSNGSLKRVHLELHMSSPPSFFLSQSSKVSVPDVSKARISFSESSDFTKKEEDETSQAFKIDDSGRVLSSAGLPNGANKEELEKLISALNEEKVRTYNFASDEFYDMAATGNIIKVLYMLAKGIDPNQKFETHEGETALHAAAANGHVTVVHLLVQAGAVNDSLNEKVYTPLMLAVENAHRDVVHYLVKKGALTDFKGENGMSSLHLAAKSGDLEILKILMSSRETDIDAQDDGGWTPIVWASEHDHLNVVKYLLKRGANPNLRDNEGNIGLHWSAFSGSVEISYLYLDYGCDINAVNELGDTPLHIAARQDSFPCVTLFLSRGADVTIQNKAGKLPAECCIDKNSDTYLSLSLNMLLKKITGKYQHKAEKIIHRDVSRGKEQLAIQCVNAFDDEMAPLDFLYVTENCETMPIKIDRTITSLQSCHCEDDCSTSSCSCASISYQCWYDKEGLLLPEFNLLDPPMLFECNRACSCWSLNCHNRVLQNGITSRLQLMRTKGKGWGVRTLKDIPKGAFICEYVGELISDSAADKRADDSYLFDLDNRDGETYCLDARYYGNISRFINHLCEPNLVPVKVYVDHQDLNFPRIAFFSSRDIKQYEELGFDYGEKFWAIKYKSFTCECGVPKCKYSKESIHVTLANYYRRLKEEQMEEAAAAAAAQQQLQPTDIPVP